MAQPKELNAFEKLNKALAEYYQMQGNTTFYDDNDNKAGKFLAYCEENGFELEDIEEEFQNDPSDCIYCDFDDEFPIDKSIKIVDDDQRIIEIFNVIKYCFENDKPPKYFSTMNLTLTLSKDDIKVAEKQYTAQCPKIFKSQEETLKEVFAIGLKNDFPFISYLVDAYQRDRMLSQESGSDLSASNWAKESPYIKKIQSKSKQQATTIQSGIETYMKRVCPRFHWKPMNKIQDDIKPIIKYFISAGQFVDSLLQQKQTTPPFAYDVVIIVKKTVSNSTTVIPDLSDSDDDEDDDDDGPDDLKSNDDAKDYFNDIEGKLKSNSCSFISKKMKGNNRGARFMMETFKAFSNKLGNDKYNEPKKGYDMKQYPRKKRFCAMIDRRGGGGGASDKSDDSLIMFEPPDDSNTMPDKHVPDWYFNAGKTCLIPSKSYKQGSNVANYDAQATVRVDNAYKGQMITISFQVDSSQSIRCYLFWNGCYVRIVYPSDLRKILQTIFDTKYKDNEQYLKSQQSDDDMKGLKIIDETFDTFYKEVTVNKK